MCQQIFTHSAQVGTERQVTQGATSTRVSSHNGSATATMDDKFLTLENEYEAIKAERDALAEKLKKLGGADGGGGGGGKKEAKAVSIDTKKEEPQLPPAASPEDKYRAAPDAPEGAAADDEGARPLS